MTGDVSGVEAPGSGAGPGPGGGAGAISWIGAVGSTGWVGTGWVCCGAGAVVWARAMVGRAASPSTSAAIAGLIRAVMHDLLQAPSRHPGPRPVWGSVLRGSRRAWGSG